MVRLLAIVLLVMLPIQFSWAAVAAYCEHESTSQAQGTGHHEHEHHQIDAGPSHIAADADTPADIDTECGHCHGHCAGALLNLDTMAPFAKASLATRWTHSRLRLFASPPPDRPQWAALA